MPLNLPKPVLGQLLIQLSSVGGWHPVDVTLCEEALFLIPHSTAVPNHLRKVFVHNVTLEYVLLDIYSLQKQLVVYV